MGTVWHDFAVLVIRAQAFKQLRAQGHNIIDSIEIASQVDSGAVNAAISVATPEVKQAVGTIGDGSLLSALEAFLQSPLGQLLISILMKALIGV